MEEMNLQEYEAYIAKELIQVDEDLNDNLVQLTNILGNDYVDELLSLKKAHFRLKLIKDHQTEYLLSKHSAAP